MANQNTHRPKGKTFGECVEVTQKDYQGSKGYYPKQRDFRCQSGSGVRVGTAGGLLQEVRMLCMGMDRRSSCAALRRGNSKELASLAGSVGQEVPCQQQGQGTALTREALAWDRDNGPWHSQFSANPRGAPHCF